MIEGLLVTAAIAATFCLAWLLRLMARRAGKPVGRSTSLVAATVAGSVLISVVGREALFVAVEVFIYIVVVAFAALAWLVASELRGTHG